MNITQMEEVVKQLASDVIANEVNKDEFIYELMATYGHRKTTIGRIKSGERNLANVEGEVRAKRHIYFKQSQSHQVLSDIDSMKKEPSVARDKIRFVIATDFNQFVALDTRTHDTLDIEFAELGKHFDFFLPWAGMEKAVYQGENPADVKAAEKMAKLFDLIKADNFSEQDKDDTSALHNLNVFLTRLLFCFFAEDTGIFTPNQFSAALESHTKLDGSDVDSYLNRLFEVLNTAKGIRCDLPEYLADFEYVNGGLFANTIACPGFSTKSRKMLIECGSELDWSDINPDIFGSMIQAVVHPDQRGGMGMHYTSVTNIMKVIEPLFLNDLYAELENIEDNIDVKLQPSRLRKLHDRIAEIKIFDPACGSGNFLIIAFKELRKLEMEIIKRLQELAQNDSQDDLFGDVGLDSSFSRIKLSQFYGIELDDFAHEVAILSLWLTEHQMNVEFKAEFGECEPTLPLQDGGNIIQGNAATLDWSKVCPNKGSHEVFVLGNPPYQGFKNQSENQKKDMAAVLGEIKGFKSLDYIAIWFFKAAKFIERNGGASFVSTNSISQGTQVELIWPSVLEGSVEISFAVRPFKWANSAKGNAGVTCVIIGLRKINNKPKYIYTDLLKIMASNINSYLIDSSNVIVSKMKKPLSKLPRITDGSGALDGGHLIINDEERKDLLSSSPEAAPYIRKYVGSNEFINGNSRWCLWITDENYEEAINIPAIKQKVEAVISFRENAGTRAKTAVGRPHKFAWINIPKSSQIIIPTISSERRTYIPIGYLDTSIVVSNSASIVHDPELFDFAILTSRMHMVWVKAVAGKLEERIRYTSAVCYNTFPIPQLNRSQKEELSNLALGILSAREIYSERNMADLYDPDKMPNDLINRHKQLDDFVDSIYETKPFKADMERLEVLFDLYKKMTGGQNA
jgi:hypothetical protein